MVNRVEFLASNADLELMESIGQLLGQDRSHVIRLAVRRMAVHMKATGWPIEIPGSHPKG